MKKWLLILGIITCMAGMTACGQKTEDVEDLMTVQEAEDLAESCVSTVNQVIMQQGEDSYIALAEQNGVDGAVFENAFESWKSISDELGNYEEIIEISSNTMVGEDYYGTTYPVEGTIVARIQCEKRSAQVEIIYKNHVPANITFNVEYTFGENMKKAVLNTILGMGTVFVVLILICLIISCFNFIPKIQEKLSKKKTVNEEVKKETVESAVVPAAENEELSDDLELVAVIAAAIAASEGASSTDGFVVRSIRRAKSRWQKA